MQSNGSTDRDVKQYFRFQTENILHLAYSLQGGPK